ncbi:hypothetical protein IZU99_07525 [Oscillospiraceae bacterium CM]|nr:hypothetical protein IZU99_07525 [Oscillospiraceae bacterium CM]
MHVTVTGGNLTAAEREAYIAHAHTAHPDKIIDGLDIKLSGEYADLTYHWKTVPFERIRRITGYLVGTLDRFNDGKRAEEADRVKHCCKQ